MIPELNGDFLQWLRGFYYVAKTGSVRRAAELMHRNPSTISYQLRSLETELNTVLFDRYKKSLQITPEGKKLLGWTITTFETLQSMRSAVGTTDGRLQGDIFLGATLPVAIMAVDAIAAFRAENPQVNIRIQRALSSEIVQAVKESRLDFGLTGMTALPKQDTMEILLKARPLLVMRKDSIWDIPPSPPKRIWSGCPSSSFRHRWKRASNRRRPCSMRHAACKRTRSSASTTTTLSCSSFAATSGWPSWTSCATGRPCSVRTGAPSSAVLWTICCPTCCTAYLSAGTSISAPRRRL